MIHKDFDFIIMTIKIKMYMYIELYMFSDVWPTTEYVCIVLQLSTHLYLNEINLYIDHSNSSSCSQIYCTFYILCSITCDCVITWSGWRKGNVFDFERVHTHSEIIHIQ